MVRVTESVKVTRRETTTMRPVDAGHDFEEAGHGPSGYRDEPSRAGRFGKLKMPKFGRDHQPEDAGAEADSLLSGLAPRPGHEDDWYAPGDDRARAGRPGVEPDGPTGGWRTEERSAELRMGMRHSRTAPDDEWGRRDMGTAGDRRAIGDSEAEPTTRWGQGNAAPPWGAGRSPRDYDVGGSYMDRYYGER